MAVNVSNPTLGYGQGVKPLDEVFEEMNTTTIDDAPCTTAGDDATRVLPGHTEKDLPSNQQHGDKDRDPLNPSTEGPGKPAL
jgi:hypothetical protein